MVPLLWEINHHRHVQPGVARPALAAGHAAAVVAIVEDDGIVCQPGFGEFLQPLARIRIRLTDLVIILRPILPHFGRIGVIGRYTNVLGLGDLSVGPGANLALVAFGGVEDGEERLACSPLFPMRLVGRFIPHLALLAHVVVGLAVVGAVVACLPQKLRIHLRASGHRHHRAHVQATCAGGIQARDDGGAGRRTHRSHRPSLFENHAFSRQRVHIRRAGQLVPVTPHLWTMILTGEPEDVRLIRSGE